MLSFQKFRLIWLFRTKSSIFIHRMYSGHWYWTGDAGSDSEWAFYIKQYRSDLIQDAWIESQPIPLIWQFIVVAVCSCVHRYCRQITVLCILLIYLVWMTHEYVPAQAVFVFCYRHTVFWCGRASGCDCLFADSFV